ncbi:dNA-binding response regulator [Clostridium sp. CAG:411]|mgnify:CR=1 FL=1|jgi:DNA-binding response OmpR family regulator|nr:response regulator transcription factor [Lachnospiraceae bacterium]CDE46281.1 dNA-binding response regulator [Clostridium sp. CAG:411]
MVRLLIVEDEKKLRVLMSDFFKMKGYEVSEAENGIDATKILQQQEFDMIFLDIMMPGMDGIEVCKKVRTQTDVPILFLTALYDEETKLKGYASGADDFVTKPFSLEVLYAKAEAIRKRYEKQSEREREGILNSKNLLLDTKKQVVILNNKECKLAKKEYEILKLFLENKGQIISRDQILDRVWGEEYYGYDRTVDTHIKKLRKMIGDAAEPLQTIYKAGYIWKE